MQTSIFIILTFYFHDLSSREIKKHVQNSAFPTNLEPPVYNIETWVKQLHLQQCVFVEIGDKYYAIFIEIRPRRYDKEKRIQEYFIGLCDAVTLFKWSLCSPSLSKKRESDCNLASYNQSGARVHRRLCDITSLSRNAPQCNCDVELSDSRIYKVQGFPTCFKDPLPDSLCGENNVCGLWNCKSDMVNSKVATARCDRKCMFRQPFCETPNISTTKPPEISSFWTDWANPFCTDLTCLSQFDEATCINKKTGKGDIDCLGPGTSCCVSELQNCRCHVYEENEILKVFRTFSITPPELVEYMSEEDFINSIPLRHITKDQFHKYPDITRPVRSTCLGRALKKTFYEIYDKRPLRFGNHYDPNKNPLKAVKATVLKNNIRNAGDKHKHAKKHKGSKVKRNNRFTPADTDIDMKAVITVVYENLHEIEEIADVSKRSNDTECTATENCAETTATDERTRECTTTENCAKTTATCRTTEETTSECTTKKNCAKTTATCTSTDERTSECTTTENCGKTRATCTTTEEITSECTTKGNCAKTTATCTVTDERTTTEDESNTVGSCIHERSTEHECTTENKNKVTLTTPYESPHDLEEVAEQAFFDNYTVYNGDPNSMDIENFTTRTSTRTIKSTKPTRPTTTTRRTTTTTTATPTTKKTTPCQKVFKENYAPVITSQTTVKTATICTKATETSDVEDNDTPIITSQTTVKTATISTKATETSNEEGNDAPIITDQSTSETTIVFTKTTSNSDLQETPARIITNQTALKTTTISRKSTATTDLQEDAREYFIDLEESMDRVTPAGMADENDNVLFTKKIPEPEDELLEHPTTLYTRKDLTTDSEDGDEDYPKDGTIRTIRKASLNEDEDLLKNFTSELVLSIPPEHEIEDEDEVISMYRVKCKTTTTEGGKKKCFKAANSKPISNKIGFKTKREVMDELSDDDDDEEDDGSDDILLEYEELTVPPILTSTVIESELMNLNAQETENNSIINSSNYSFSYYCVTFFYLNMFVLFFV